MARAPRFLIAVVGVVVVVIVDYDTPAGERIQRRARVRRACRVYAVNITYVSTRCVIKALYSAVSSGGTGTVCVNASWRNQHAYAISRKFNITSDIHDIKPCDRNKGSKPLSLRRPTT